ncbi:MAG: DUF4097 family beta strand repeat-containing protein [Aeromicrobium sp.]|uniref:DUF4097 family beta strand repeat-containing protein n=1 Tax=Aeromicrobium sp. TaxID=1871063 RepID=UPI002629AC02|nr:DUF4097 family beta strand repeat-containing protein [Aeromicrobium sp.]MDF1706438.1 DUF4097 family beta strand repeat-containing protein [Aeromicrobium sp.]
MSGFDPVEPEIDDLGDPRSPLSRTLITVAATAVVVLLVIGLVLGVGRLTRSTETTTDTFAIDPNVPLRFVVENLDVRVVAAETEIITVEVDLVSGWLGTDFDGEQDRGEVRLSASCLPLLIPGCGGAATITVPTGTQFELQAMGRDVDLDGIDGVATIRTGSGDVTGRDLALVDLGVTTGSGDVDLEFGQQPYSVKATTTSGDVDVAVPQGDLAYDVVTTSASGDVESDLEPGGDDAEGFIAVESDSGDVDLRNS